MLTISDTEMLIRLFSACGVGFLLGWERGRNSKQAGSRTHILVCLMACVTSIISAYGYVGNIGFVINSDPARLVVGVLTGIGFLGTGLIWKDSQHGISGITTAANIFLTAVLGIAVGLGLYKLTIATTLIAYLTLESDNFKKKLKKLFGNKEDDAEEAEEAEDK